MLFGCDSSLEFGWYWVDDGYDVEIWKLDDAFGDPAWCRFGMEIPIWPWEACKIKVLAKIEPPQE